MCAGTVVEPPVAISAASVSVTSRSRSVAFSDNCAFSARSSTFPRIGMVLRRSTTRWTWPSDFRSCARSTVTFICNIRPIQQEHVVETPGGLNAPRLMAPASLLFKAFRGTVKWRGWGVSSRDRSSVSWLLGRAACFLPLQIRTAGRGISNGGTARPGLRRALAPCTNRSSHPGIAVGGADLLLQLPLQRFHLFGQRGVLGDQRLDLADRVQHRGLIAPSRSRPLWVMLRAR